MKTVDIEHGGSDIYRRSPHEVIQSRDSIEVGASGLYWVLDSIAARRINLVGALA